MPVGTDWDEVGFAFNEPVVRGLLRGRYGYDGIVLTDWNLLEGTQMGDFVFGPNGWGLEDRSPAERLRLAFGAGVDQFGGDRCTQLVDAGHITTERLDASVRRILLEKFRLGLFDQHPVDPAHALQICGSSELVARGEQAQRDALVLLKDQTDSGDRLLPLTPGTRVFGDGIDPSQENRSDWSPWRHRRTATSSSSPSAPPTNRTTPLSAYSTAVRSPSRKTSSTR